MEDLSYQKKLINNKKIFGIPVLVFIIISISLLVAASVVSYFFMEDIRVHGIISRATVPTITPLVVTGDTNPILNCTVNESCSTEIITVFNPTQFEQRVLLNTLIMNGNISSTSYTIFDTDVVNCSDVNESIMIRIEGMSTHSIPSNVEICTNDKVEFVNVRAYSVFLTIPGKNVTNLQLDTAAIHEETFSDVGNFEYTINGLIFGEVLVSDTQKNIYTESVFETQLKLVYIDSNETLTFVVNYNIGETDDFEFDSVIMISSNMTLQ